jgi:ABC-type multidrug transport system permease subunit
MLRIMETLYRIAGFVKKELLELRRSRLMLVLMFVAPVVQLVLLGYAVTFDVGRLPLYVINADSTKTSQALLDRLSRSPHFSVREIRQKNADPVAFIRSGRAFACVKLEEGFEAAVRESKPAPVSAWFDGSDPTAALLGRAYLRRLLGVVGIEIAIRQHCETYARVHPGVMVPEFKVQFNPHLRSSVFYIPGVLSLVLMIATLMLTSMAVAREREMHTLELLAVTPLGAWELVLGKILAFTLVGCINTSLVITAGLLWFRVPFIGEPGLLVILCMLFILTTLGMGLLISMVARNQREAMLLSFSYVFPNVVLSGFVFPIQSMPPAVQLITYLLPLRYFIEGVRGILLKGASFSMLIDQLIPLAVFALVVPLFAVIRFRRVGF